jgi:hypothetical protein
MPGKLARAESGAAAHITCQALLNWPMLSESFSSIAQCQKGYKRMDSLGNKKFSRAARV